MEFLRKIMGGVGEEGGIVDVFSISKSTTPECSISKSTAAEIYHAIKILKVDIRYITDFICTWSHHLLDPTTNECTLQGCRVSLTTMWIVYCLVDAYNMLLLLMWGSF